MLIVLLLAPIRSASAAKSVLQASATTDTDLKSLPIFLTQTLNASGSVVGLVEGIAEATQNIVQGFSGWLSDKLQRRKPIALAGYALAAIAKPLMGITTSSAFGPLGAAFPIFLRRVRNNAD
jgi:MFS family permease